MRSGLGDVVVDVLADPVSACLYVIFFTGRPIPLPPELVNGLVRLGEWGSCCGSISKTKPARRRRLRWDFVVPFLVLPPSTVPATFPALWSPSSVCVVEALLLEDPDWSR